VTSHRQNVANRLNGRRSTGPRTNAGKQRASQNARRHGLTAAPNADTLAAIHALATRLTIAGQGLLNSSQALAIAEAHVHEVRVRNVRTALSRELDNLIRESAKLRRKRKHPSFSYWKRSSA
jgi:hypothetical protein